MESTLKDHLPETSTLVHAGEGAVIKLQRSYQVTNERGLHARAATLIVQTLKKYAADVQLERDGLRVNGDSIIGILRLMAAKGSQITAYGRGPEAEEALDAIGELIGDKFC